MIVKGEDLVPIGVYIRTKAHRQCISEGMHKAYAEERFIPWTKGKTKKTDKRILRMAQKCSKALKEYAKTKEGKMNAKKRGVVRYKLYGCSQLNTAAVIRKRAKAIKEYANTKKGKVNLSAAGRLGGRAFVVKYGGWASYNIMFKAKNPKEYCEQLIRRGREGAFAALKSRREGYPFYFMDVPFDSGAEREVAKVLHKEIAFIPIEGENCHVKVGNIEIDFWPIKKAVLEYHPWDHNAETVKKYYAKRRKILDKNGYETCRLIVIKSLRELTEVVRQLNELKRGS